jgi:hypothetical protein
MNEDSLHIAPSSLIDEAKQMMDACSGFWCSSKSSRRYHTVFREGVDDG